MKISLMVLSAGKAAGKALPVTVQQFVIGRDPQCNLRPASAMISKRHCAIISKAEGVFVRDFDSTNGTFVNEQPVKGEVQVNNGDVLKVGPLSFKIELEAAPVAANAPVAAAPAPKPVPAPVLADMSDDDAAAAALLSIDDDGQASLSVAGSETAQDAIPGGTTIMDMPAIAAPDGSQKADAKADDKKSGAKKHQQGAAQDAAKALLDKLRAGKRGK
jgi:predicted component of type VI protein secretion system